jgi:hypothetical protein
MSNNALPKHEQIRVIQNKIAHLTGMISKYIRRFNRAEEAYTSSILYSKYRKLLKKRRKARRAYKSIDNDENNRDRAREKYHITCEDVNEAECKYRNSREYLEYRKLSEKVDKFRETLQTTQASYDTLHEPDKKRQRREPERYGTKEDKRPCRYDRRANGYSIEYEEVSTTTTVRHDNGYTKEEKKRITLNIAEEIAWENPHSRNIGKNNNRPLYS